MFFFKKNLIDQKQQIRHKKQLETYLDLLGCKE
jgi:hypothetical protein